MCKPRFWLWAILLTSLALKLWVILKHGPIFDLHSDDRAFLTSAQILLERGVLTYGEPNHPTLFMMPLFPAYLTLFMKLLGPGLVLEQTIRVLQAFIMTFCLYLLFCLGKKLGSEWSAVGAVLLAAFFPPLWLVSNFILTEALFTLALLLLIAASLRALDAPSAMSAVAFGLAWTFATYIRPTIALWPAIFFLMLLTWRILPWRRLLKYALIVGVTFTICLLPWWVRNYQVSGRFIPLAKSSGNPLLLGTFPYTLPALEEQRTWHVNLPTLDEQDDLDRAWAMHRIREGFHRDFLHYARWYTVGKFLMFWKDVYYWVEIPGIPRSLVKGYQGMLLLFGFLGMISLQRKRLGGLLLGLFAYFTLLHMVYLAHGRYAVPLMPLLCLFSSEGLARTVRLFPFAHPRTPDESPAGLPSGEERA